MERSSVICPKVKLQVNIYVEPAHLPYPFFSEKGMEGVRVSTSRMKKWLARVWHLNGRSGLEHSRADPWSNVPPPLYVINKTQGNSNSPFINCNSEPRWPMAQSLQIPQRALVQTTVQEQAPNSLLAQTFGKFSIPQKDAVRSHHISFLRNQN